ncbi:MAG TPA: hypothetical protein DEB63_12155 [Agrobacterium sp.]|nr:hypothetical protein [Agrobacterium sp.]
MSSADRVKSKIARFSSARASLTVFESAEAMEMIHAVYAGTSILQRAFAPSSFLSLQRFWEQRLRTRIVH